MDVMEVNEFLIAEIVRKKCTLKLRPGMNGILDAVSQDTIWISTSETHRKPTARHPMSKLPFAMFRDQQIFRRHHIELRQRQRNKVTIDCSVHTFVASRIGFHQLSAASYLWHIGHHVKF